MSGVSSVDGQQDDLLEEYRTAPLKLPLHVLDEHGEALCGNLAEKQERFLDREGYLNQPTIEEKRDGEPWKYFHGDLCGACRAVLLSRSDDEAMHRGWEIREEAIRNVLQR